MTSSLLTHKGQSLSLAFNLTCVVVNRNNVMVLISETISRPFWSVGCLLNGSNCLTSLSSVIPVSSNISRMAAASSDSFFFDSSLWKCICMIELFNQQHLIQMIQNNTTGTITLFQFHRLIIPDLTVTTPLSLLKQSGNIPLCLCRHEGQNGL